MTWAIAPLQEDEVTVVLTVLAFVVPPGIYLLSKPQRSSREAQIRSALVLLAAALVWAGAINTHPTTWALVLELVIGAGFAVLAVWLLVKDRRPYGAASPGERRPRN